jgi:hypothetical protein
MDRPHATAFCRFLDAHSKEFLELRFRGIGFHEATELMKERFRKTLCRIDDDPGPTSDEVEQ